MSGQRGETGQHVHLANQVVGHPGSNMTRPARDEGQARAALINRTFRAPKHSIIEVAIVRFLGPNAVHGIRPVIVKHAAVVAGENNQRIIGKF